MLIREEGGQKTLRKLKSEFKHSFNHLIITLKSNDVVYVEPNRARVAESTRTTQFLPILLSGLSFAAIIIDRITR